MWNDVDLVAQSTTGGSDNSLTNSNVSSRVLKTKRNENETKSPFPKNAKAALTLSVSRTRKELIVVYSRQAWNEKFPELRGTKKYMHG